MKNFYQIATVNVYKLASVLLPLILLAGCSVVPWRHKVEKLSSSFLTQTGSKVEQKGPAEKPSVVDTKVSKTWIPLPALTAVTIGPMGEFTFKLPETANLTSDTRTEHYQAPTTFAPPSPSEVSTAEAKATGIRWFYIAGLLCLIGSGICAYRAHIKAALILFAGAFVVPLVGVVISSEWAIHLLEGVVCIAGALVAAWYFFKKDLPLHHANELAEASAKVAALKQVV